MRAALGAGACKVVDAFRALNLGNHDAQSVNAVDRQHIPKENDVQAHNADTVPIAKNGASVNALKIDVGAVSGFVGQFPVSVFEGKRTVVAGDKLHFA